MPPRLAPVPVSRFAFLSTVPLVFWLGVVVVVGLVVFFLWARYGGDDFNEDQPPEVKPEADVRAEFNDGQKLDLGERIIYVEVPVRARGVARTEETVAARDSFVAAAVDSDSTRAPVFPPFDVVIENDEGDMTLGAVRSDGVYESRDFRCRPRCEAGARDTSMFANEKRSLPRLLPDLLKGAATCAAFGAAGYGVAWGVQQINRERDPATGEKEPLNVDPLLVAGAAGGGCVVAKLVF